MATAQQMKFRGAGVDLAADVAGPAEGPPILFLHGSGQTRKSWGKALVEAGRRGYRAISMDLRGHGDSGWSPDGNYALDIFADDLRAVIDQIGAPPIVIGASLGGIVSMIVSAAAPDAIRGLVLVDITARVEMDGAREVIAFMGSAADGFASVEEAAEAVAAYLPHRPRPKSTAGLERNLRLNGDGRYYWHWDPAFMAMGKDVDNQPEGPSTLETAARALTAPTLLIRGGRSRIVSEDGAREFLEMVPHADYVGIDGAHHMVAGDANDAFNKAVFAFVEKQAPLAA